MLKMKSLIFLNLFSLLFAQEKLSNTSKTEMKKLFLKNINEVSNSNAEILEMMNAKEGKNVKNEQGSNPLTNNARYNEETKSLSQIDSSEEGKAKSESNIESQMDASLRTRRIEFYKAFKKFRKQSMKQKMQQKTIQTAEGIENDESKEKKQLEAIYKNVNDWATFLTEQRNHFQQERRNSPIHSSYNQKNPSNMINRAQTNTTYNPMGYASQVFPSLPIQTQTHETISINPILLQTSQEGNAQDAYKLLPPPPNPRSSEASVHTVQVFLPPISSPIAYSSADQVSIIPAYIQAPLYQKQQTDLLKTIQTNSGNEYIQNQDTLGSDQNQEIDLTEDGDSTSYTINDACYPSGTHCSPGVQNLAIQSLENGRCNSERLHSIIINNIIQNDIEATKRRIQAVCEKLFGNIYNVICGTGYFSYTAHTEEYCLISLYGINCYVFSPICNYPMNISKKKARLRVKA